MKILIEYFEKNQIAWDSQMINKLDAYMNGILQWNEHINLTAIREPEDFIRKHYLDSLSCILLPEYQEAGMIADMGTGAGFPGIPLAIFSPEKKVRPHGLSPKEAQCHRTALCRYRYR